MIKIAEKAIGIDINAAAVSFVELQKDASQIKVLRSGNLPIDGIIDNGIVKNPQALTNLLKKLKFAGPFQRSGAVLTICAEPALLQILNLPDSSPDKVKKFVQNEVRQYAILPLKNIVTDYCGLRSADTETKRVLVGAGQGEYLSSVVKAVEKNNIVVKAVEPAITAFIRTCFNKVIKPAGKKNIMLLLLRGDNLNLCVFEKQRLEFLRTKKFEFDIAGSQERCKWLKNEIESILRFYEFEKETNTQNWQIVIAGSARSDDCIRIVDEIAGQISRRNIEIIPFNNSMLDAAIDVGNNKEISPVAVGSAMKLLDEGISGIKLNLLPGEIIADRKNKKELLVITNIAVGLFVFMLLLIAVLGKKSINAGNNIYTMQQKMSAANMLVWFETKKDLDERIKIIEQDNAVIEKTVESRKYYNWARLLVDLGVACPKTVLMENLELGDDNTIKIDGLAIDYASADKFVNLLAQSKNIESASLVSAGQSAEFDGLVDYSILCSLVK